MKKALQIISIQHELSMAIGNCLDLKEMLKIFMRVSMARLNLSSTHLFLFCDEVGEPVHLVEAVQGLNAIAHYMSMPKQYLGLAWAESRELKRLASAHLLQTEAISQTLFDEKYYFCFSVPEHGVMIFETVSDMDGTIKKSLLPIFKKFALSCYACIAHQALLKEMCARRSAEDTIAHQATHDELTQLCNRRKLTENLEKALEDSRFNRRYGALLFIDLNQFKSINDLMGHDVGDKILREVAARLKSITRGKDTVARFGGDEFIILLADLGRVEQDAELIVYATATRICDVIETPFHIDEMVYNVGCSIGFEIFPSASDTYCDVIKHADLAMYEAKLLRQRAALRYRAAMSEKLNARTECVAELKNALKNNEFMLYYQPQYNADGEVVGAEALLRWNNPKRMHESPEVFIPIAEDSELILAIGDWVLYEACRHLKQLQELGLPLSFKKLSINVSAKQLAQDNFFEHIFRAVQASGVDARQLMIEITENILITRIHDAMALISRLKALGVDCAIDDFGMGYSSLTYLKRLRTSMIKIDKSFVKDIHKDTENRSIVRMIVALAQNLEMAILAEGVEGREELQVLNELGCSHYQGYYFNRPLPFDELLALLAVKQVEAC
jgi:diguanylate cyclase